MSFMYCRLNKFKLNVSLILDWGFVGAINILPVGIKANGQPAAWLALRRHLTNRLKDDIYMHHLVTDLSNLTCINTEPDININCRAARFVYLHFGRKHATEKVFVISLCRILRC